MLLRSFKVNNGALEVLDSSNTSRAKKVDTQDKVLL